MNNHVDNTYHSLLLYKFCYWLTCIWTGGSDIVVFFIKIESNSTFPRGADPTTPTTTQGDGNNAIYIGKQYWHSDTYNKIVQLP